MIAHLGSGKLTRDGDIVGIFDLDGEVTPPITAEFLKSANKEGKVTTAADDIPRSFVLVADGKTDGVIITRLSSAALSKRIEEGMKGTV